ncbi:2-oxo acid dehydrogenase subunit E2 [Microcoleus sp. herbarium19]|uniref:2-oxo acid dehydrogenase subunit E2 n=1 Tax=unclassified Microcoleus TaxID=2642155 RepID=UPI002FD14290
MNSFEVSEFPKSRFATFDVGIIGRKKHHIIALLEIDVTAAKAKIKDQLKSGRDIGFTAWLLKVIATTIETHKYIHSINYKGRKQIVFNDIDISIPIEKEVDGIQVPLATVIREVNKKSIDEINSEIKQAKNKNVNSEEDYVLNESENKGSKIFFNLPQFMRLIIWKFILINLFTKKKNMGTVIVTNIGMFGKFPGWIIPKSIHNLCFGVGTIMKKPWISNNMIAIRDIMHLTILFDHDAVDGSPAAKFTDALVRNIENAIEL